MIPFVVLFFFVHKEWFKHGQMFSIESRNKSQNVNKCYTPHNFPFYNFMLHHLQNSCMWRNDSIQYFFSVMLCPSCIVLWHHQHHRLYTPLLVTNLNIKTSYLVYTCILKYAHKIFNDSDL